MKVLQSGRLGNFLFQWAFANNLANTSKVQTQIIFDRFHSDISHLHDLQVAFNSNKVVLEPRNILGYGFKILDYIGSKSPQIESSLQGMLNIYTEGQSTSRKGFEIYRGYFQEPEFALSLLEEDFSKLLQKIYFSRKELQSRSPNLIGTNDYQVVHLRLGDFKNSPFGVLKLESMLELLNPHFKTVICTDGTSEEVTARIGRNDFTVLSPLETSAWEALSVISGAKRVISSNSTLSWWGAFLASKNGAEVFLPDQWRKDYFGNLNMQFPGANLFSSDFE